MMSGGWLRVMLAASSLAWVVGCAGSRGPAPSGAGGPEQMLPEERLGVDDVFDIRVSGEAELSGAYRVAADGTINYPHLGRLSVLGMRSTDLEDSLAKGLAAGYIRRPQVSVFVKEWNSRKISVMGQVKSPGYVPYFPNMTLVEAVSAAGGFTSTASKNMVTLTRSEKGAITTHSYPVGDMAEGKAANVLVLPRDVIIVEERMF